MIILERDLTIAAADGVCDCVFYRPGEAGFFPGVLHLTDIGGIRQSHRDMARRVASLGYVVMMPNVFYRSGRPPVIEYPLKPGDEKTMLRFNELTSALGPDAMDRDVVAYLDFLAAQDRVNTGRTAVVGYCYTGAMALRAAAACPLTVVAAASFHGGHLCTDAPTSPHLLLPRVKARLCIGHAVNDRTMAADAIERLNRALEGWGGQYESEVFEGCAHGWTVPDHPAYNKSQADRAFAKLSALLSITLQAR